MTKELYIHTSELKSHASDRDRGSPQTSLTWFRMEDFLAVPDVALATTLAMHKAMAQNWGCWNRFCTETYRLARPYYMFPWQIAQQYFSFILGCQQYLGEPVAMTAPGPRVVRAEQDEREEQAAAMDIATGACTEMWVVVEEGRAAAMAA